MIKDLVVHLEEKMSKSIKNLEAELATLKAGRANPTMLDRIEVEYYGSMVPISQVGSISAPEPRILMITPWEKSALKAIEKAINTSDLNINPNNDGSVIRLIIPELTEETRKNLVKVVNKKGEEAKIAIRNVRRDTIDKIKAMKKELSEDEIKKGEEDVQKKVDEYIKRVDKIVTDKEKEIMKV
ncbi:ribosome recycling factor [Proteiniclasticum sp. BAD-10]|uniref:Ribosome-recycling factor n=1 Tax=Proteiniclasticum sediminis TaxID=2804028 RepID=A0A941HPY5_9CLOT|nr:ribosome recycling factor [Proteiniclasticum sediminis]MBR0575485.1 ribosome recycling factor [Proteiniclasticum sediminis]